MIATAGIATGLEARLRQARQEALLAQQQAQQAELRATQVGCCCALAYRAVLERALGGLVNAVPYCVCLFGSKHSRQGCRPLN